jgi:endo-1,4-beta-xylanase
MCDRYSWIEGFEPRKDGAKRRPCPYDDRFAAKPMRAAIADALGHARPRKA